ncbi:MAG: SDR family NAD(P)-dependent oxidoreductase [Bacteroidales bacterium]|nr:SDR family NAD(P)-dependent oxidoreductase [Bacteroidales bacterium]
MKTALITGADSGIGLAYARELARQGWQTVLVSNRERELAEAARALQAENGLETQHLCVDLAERGSAQRVLDWCDAQQLEIELLVNNAGIYFMEYLSEENLPKVRTMIALHVENVTEMCILFGARMKARGHGYILNMSSMTARIPAPGIAVYSATKAYLKSFGKGFSYEMRPFGVKVTTVCPAAVDTGLYQLSDRTRRTGRRLGLIQSPEALARRALRATFRGRRVISPTPVNKLLPPLIALLPSRTIDRLGMKWLYRKSNSTKR